MFPCKFVVDVFDAFHAMVRSCFGNVWYQERYENDIKAFARSFFILKQNCDDITHLKNPKKPIKLSATPKVHGTLVHIRQYLIRRKELHGIEFGLGCFSEQTSG